MREYQEAKGEYDRLKRQQPSVSRSFQKTPAQHGAQRLCLVARRGPLSFTICEKSSPGVPFTVTLGDAHRCTCSSGPRCSHVRWVLTAVLGLGTSSSRQPGLSKLDLARALEAAPRQLPVPPVARTRPSRVGPELDGESVSWLLGLSDEDAFLLTQVQCV